MKKKIIRTIWYKNEIKTMLLANNLLNLHSYLSDKQSETRKYN